MGEQMIAEIIILLTIIIGISLWFYGYFRNCEPPYFDSWGGTKWYGWWE
jgi:hypothetical protein